MKVEDVLKNFSKIKAEIKVMESRIVILKELLSLDDLSEYYENETGNYRRSLVSRPTENQALLCLNMKLHNNAVENIKKEINNLKSKIITKQNIVSLIDIAFEALTEIQLYIIKCIYFHKMTYLDVLENLRSHKKYKNKKVWCVQTIFNIRVRAINIINSITGNYINSIFIINL